MPSGIGEIDYEHGTAIRPYKYEDELKGYNPQDISCRFFGHVCPVYFYGYQNVTETKELRRHGRYIPREIMLKVVRRDDYRCRLCGNTVDDRNIEFDHPRPTTELGSGAFSGASAAEAPRFFDSLNGSSRPFVFKAAKSGRRFRWDTMNLPQEIFACVAAAPDALSSAVPKSVKVFGDGGQLTAGLGKGTARVKGQRRLVEFCGGSLVSSPTASRSTLPSRSAAGIPSSTLEATQIVARHTG